ncbi:MAG TPA: hypothetical protein VNA19_16885 [Pyrinomonadaceae bacterium]|jgi:hypothetical protein|nr:hypothetical protein [Pyrinomonadaceae bacterium]
MFFAAARGDVEAALFVALFVAVFCARGLFATASARALFVASAGGLAFALVLVAARFGALRFCCARA